MSMPFDRPCIFCNGKYVKICMAKGYEDYEISSLIVAKVGSNQIEMAKSVIYQCETCGNIQSFTERQPKV
jgi:hypothetical protein